MDQNGFSIYGSGGLSYCLCVHMECSCLLPVGMNARNDRISSYESGSRDKCLIVDQDGCTLTHKSIPSLLCNINIIVGTCCGATCTSAMQVALLACMLRICNNPKTYHRIMFRGSSRGVKLPTSDLVNHLMLFYLVSTPC